MIAGLPPWRAAFWRWTVPRVPSRQRGRRRPARGRHRVGSRHARRTGRQGTAADRTAGAGRGPAGARPGALLELARAASGGSGVGRRQRDGRPAEAGAGRSHECRGQGLRRAIEEQVEALAQPDVEVPNGTRLHIHPTPALVAIDVDAGGTVASRQGKAASHLAANRRCCRCWRGRSGCATCPARSWWISPECRRAAAPRWRLPCTPRWQMIRCVRGCSASPRLAWRRSSARACIRRCMNCSLDRMPPGWRRCVDRRRGRGPAAPDAGAAGVAGDRGGASGRWRGAGGSCAPGGARLDSAFGSQPAGDSMDDRDERWLSAGERNRRVRFAASRRRTSCGHSAAVAAPMSIWPLADRQYRIPAAPDDAEEELAGRVNLIGVMAWAMGSGRRPGSSVGRACD